MGVTPRADCAVRRLNRARARLLKIMDAEDANDVMALEHMTVAGRA